MPEFYFPNLPMDEWQSTRDYLQSCTNFLTSIRSNLSPAQKHYGHANMRVNSSGLTTTPIPTGNSASAHSIELQLDFTSHKLVISTNRGHRFIHPLYGQSAARLCSEVLSVLANLGVHPKIDQSEYSDDRTGYDFAAVERFWQVLCQVELTLQRFRAGLREETSAVQFWPHHFDLAMLWFSGKRIPGKNPDDPEDSDEQMNFGFVTGDATLPEPYFYITAYPQPEKLAESPMPEKSYWNTNSFQGAILKYEALTKVKHPEKVLFDFFDGVHKVASKMMLD